MRRGPLPKPSRELKIATFGISKRGGKYGQVAKDDRWSLEKSMAAKDERSWVIVNRVDRDFPSEIGCLKF